MNEIRIENAWVCKINKTNIAPIFCDIIIKNGKINSFISKNFKDYVSSIKINGKKPKNVYDAAGRVVTIPHVNFHDHFYSRLAKGLDVKGDTNSFYYILHNLWWKLDRALDLNMVRASAQMSVAEAIKNGVSYIFDHHASPKSTKGSLSTIAEVIKENNLRASLSFETSDRNGAKLANLALKENIRFLEDETNDDLKAMLGLHASFTLADDTLSEAEKLVKEYKLGIHIHLAEDPTDAIISKENTGKLPLRRLRNYNLLNEKSILAHGIYLTKPEYKEIDKAGSSIAFNLDSNLNNAVGLPNFGGIADGIPILMGTDGMHGNPGRTLKNYFLLMRNKGLSFDLAFKYVVKTYFDQLAFVRRYFKDFPSLNIGDRADFVVWDYVPPTPLTSNNFWGHYIYGILERPAQSLIQKGEFILKDKKILTMNEDAVNKEIYIQGEKLSKKFKRIK